MNKDIFLNIFYTFLPALLPDTLEKQDAFVVNLN